MPKDRSSLPVAHLSEIEAHSLRSDLKKIICNSKADDTVIANVVHQFLFPEDRAYVVEQLRNIVQIDHDNSLIYASIKQSLPMTFKELWIAGGGAVQFSPYTCSMFHSLHEIQRVMQSYQASTTITDQGVSIHDLIQEEYDHYYRILELTREIDRLVINDSFKNVVESTQIDNGSTTSSLNDVRSILSNSIGKDSITLSVEVKQPEKRIEFLRSGSKSAPCSPRRQRLGSESSAWTDDLEEEKIENLMFSTGVLHFPKSSSTSSLASLEPYASSSASSSQSSGANSTPLRRSTIKRNPLFQDISSPFAKILKFEDGPFETKQDQMQAKEPPIMASDIVANLAFLDEQEDDVVLGAGPQPRC